MSKTNKKNIILLVVLFVSMIFLGIVDNVRGPALPRIQSDFDITAFHLGLIMAMSSTGYLVASAFTAMLGRRIGMTSCLVCSLAIIALTGVFLSVTPGFVFLLFAFMVLHIGSGMLDVSLNIIAGSAFTENISSRMNVIHCFYGVGAIFAPVISTSVMMVRFSEQLYGWRVMYLIVMSWAIVPAALAIISRYKLKPGNKKSDGYAKLLRMPKLWLLVATLTLGLISEVGIASWIVIYLERAHDFAPDRAALFLTFYFICFTAARLLMGPLIDKFGIVNSIILFTSLSGTLVVSGVLLGAPGAPVILAAGFAIAPLFPTIMAALSKLFYAEVDRAMTAVITAMGALLIPANLLIGAIIQISRQAFAPGHGDDAIRLAYSTGFVFIGFASFLAATVAIVLRRRLKRDGELC